MPVDTAVKRLMRRRTKIVATLGPASTGPETLRALVRAGVDVFRLNFSHGSHAEHAETLGQVRHIADAEDRPVGVLADLCGPKIRAGRFAGGGIDLVRGASVIVTVRDVEGGPGLIPSRYERLSGDVKAGDRILLDDGLIELRVEKVEGTEVACAVVEGGRLKDRKGMNLPGVAVSAPSLTEQDRADARLALELGADFIALSFVRRASDVLDLRALIEERGGGEPGVIAKIEKPEALEDIEAILRVSDGIMVARGDLGVELPPEQVPIAQSQLVDAARRAGRPVIVATQMLESMVKNARPTRAEVSDVSTAVLSGADAVMLSAETASGDHPVRAVEMMDRVARQAEGYLWERAAFGSLVPAHGAAAARLPDDPVEVAQIRLEDAIARATGQLSRDLMVRAIVVFTKSGWSAGMVAAARPQAPVIAVSPDAGARRRMNLLWGVVPVSGDLSDPAALHEEARRAARSTGLAREGEHILRVWGFHHEPRLNVPTLSVLRV
jgi:pyruvate kinase